MEAHALAGRARSGLKIALAPAADAAVRIDLVEDWKGVAALAPEWNRLLRASPAHSIFLTWEWIRCWADVVGPAVRPLVVAVRDGRRRLVGLVPLYVATLCLGPAIRYRTLRVMGDDPTGADYPDWILQHDLADAVLPEIVKALDGHRGWDLMWMPRMAGWTGSFDRLVAACRDLGLRCRTRPHDFSFFELPSDRDAYFQALSKNKRQQLRAEIKRTMRPGVEICRCETEEDVPEFLDALFDLHGRRWTEKGEAGSFGKSPLKMAFYRRFAPVALRNGWLWLWGLRDGGQLKAVQVGYAYGNVFHQLQEGFDPEYVKGAGNVLRAQVIEGCIEAGIRGYDFLGEMTEHKRRWLGRERAGHDLLVARPTLKNLLLSKAGIWPSGRFMRQMSPLRDPRRADDARFRKGDRNSGSIETTGHAQEEKGNGS